jgi:hypothetical protein
MLNENHQFSPPHLTAIPAPRRPCVLLRIASNPFFQSEFRNLKSAIEKPAPRLPGHHVRNRLLQPIDGQFKHGKNFTDGAD